MDIILPKCTLYKQADKLQLSVASWNSLWPAQVAVMSHDVRVKLLHG